jgi:hypothetical protein
MKSNNTTSIYKIKIKNNRLCNSFIYNCKMVEINITRATQMLFETVSIQNHELVKEIYKNNIIM